MKIIIYLEKDTIEDLKLAISNIQEEIDKRQSSDVIENITTDSNIVNKQAQQTSNTQQNLGINLTNMLLKNKEKMLNNPLKRN